MTSLNQTALEEARHLLAELKVFHANDAGDRAIRILRSLVETPSTPSPEAITSEELIQRTGGSCGPVDTRGFPPELREPSPLSALEPSPASPVTDPDEARAKREEIVARQPEDFEPYPAPSPEPFGLSPEGVDTLRVNGLKPEEIAGDQKVQARRVRELLHWFVRLARDSANPKWTRAHAFELAYYIATTDDRAPFDIAAVEREAWKKGLQEPAEVRDMAVRHGWIPTPQPAPSPGMGKAEAWRCPHDGGYDTEIGPIGCLLVAQGLECVCQARAAPFLAAPAAPEQGGENGE